MTKTAEALREEYVALLDQKLPEQAYQAFLEANTRLIPREFIQNHGLHFDLVLRKLAFGGDRKTDFFYLSKSSDDWHAVFVEIEKPQSRYFRGDTANFHPDFNNALQQINTWRAWLNVPANFAAFLASITPIRLPLAQNQTLARFVLVHGRRAEYGGNEHRRSLIQAQEQADFKIMSFDSLAEDLRHKDDCYIGIRRNDSIELLGDAYVWSDLFAWVEPSEFTISPALRDAVRAAEPDGPRSFRSGPNGFEPVMPYFADRVRVT